MATTSKRTRRDRSASEVGAYWERLDPVLDVEYDVGRTNLFTVRAFDDREENGVVHMQFARVSGRGRRVATMVVDDDLGQLLELHNDIGNLIERLEG
jgi:hypothetical protein